MNFKNPFIRLSFPNSRTSFTKPSASDLMYAVNASGVGLATNFDAALGRNAP